VALLLAWPVALLNDEFGPASAWPPFKAEGIIFPFWERLSSRTDILFYDQAIIRFFILFLLVETAPLRNYFRGNSAKAGLSRPF
jgi:hypothetical protein